MINILELERMKRIGGNGKTERHWLDFVVDEISLHEKLELGDFIGCFGWGHVNYENEVLKQLLLQKSKLHNEPNLIFICPECGDIGCGAVAIDINIVGDKYIWSNFRWVNGYDPYDDNSFADIGPFKFDKFQYTAELMKVKG